MGDLTDIYAPCTEKIADTLLGEPNKQFSNADQRRYGNKGSLCVHVKGPCAGRFKDFESGEEGDMVDLVMKVRGCTIREAREWLDDLCGLNSGGWS